MLKIENDCVGCDLPCLGSACRYRNVLHYYCDDCESDVNKLYKWDDGSQLCRECCIDRLFDELHEVTADDYEEYEPDEDYAYDVWREKRDMEEE